MLPDLRTEFQVTELRRQETLAAAGRYRAAQGASSRDSMWRGPEALRQRIGAALVQIGQRLQGTRPIEPAGGSAGALAVNGTSR